MLLKHIEQKCSRLASETYLVYHLHGMPVKLMAKRHYQNEFVTDRHFLQTKLVGNVKHK